MKKFIKKIIRAFGYNLFSNVIQDFYANNPFEAFRRDETKESYQYFKKFFYNSVLLLSVEDIRNYAIKKSLELSETNKKSMFLEFGVHRGESINLFANHLKKKNKKIFGFESFQGQPNDWPGYIREKGFQKLDKRNISTFSSNVDIIEGLVEDTLENFLKKHHEEKIIFVHMDLDYYPSTKFVLTKIKPFLANNAVILFHALHNYSGWKNGVIKAINETFNENEIEFIAFSSKIQGVLKFIKI